MRKQLVLYKTHFAAAVVPHRNSTDKAVSERREDDKCACYFSDANETSERAWIKK